MLRCLIKTPNERANAKDLIEFIRQGKEVDLNVNKSTTKLESVDLNDVS